MHRIQGRLHRESHKNYIYHVTGKIDRAKVQVVFNLNSSYRERREEFLVHVGETYSQRSVTLKRSRMCRKSEQGAYGVDSNVNRLYDWS